MVTIFWVWRGGGEACVCVGGGGGGMLTGFVHKMKQAGTLTCSLASEYLSIVID